MTRLLEWHGQIRPQTWFICIKLTFYFWLIDLVPNQFISLSLILLMRESVKRPGGLFPSEVARVKGGGCIPRTQLIPNPVSYVQVKTISIISIRSLSEHHSDTDKKHWPLLPFTCKIQSVFSINSHLRKYSVNYHLKTVSFTPTATCGTNSQEDVLNLFKAGINRYLPLLT